MSLSYQIICLGCRISQLKQTTTFTKQTGGSQARPNESVHNHVFSLSQHTELITWHTDQNRRMSCLLPTWSHDTRTKTGGWSACCRHDHHTTSLGSSTWTKWKVQNVKKNVLLTLGTLWLWLVNCRTAKCGLQAKTCNKTRAAGY